MIYSIYIFSILTWLFCMLTIATKNYIFFWIEIICFIVGIILFVIWLIKIKREEREMLSEFLVRNKDKEEK